MRTRIVPVWACIVSMEMVPVRREMRWAAAAVRPALQVRAVPYTFTTLCHAAARCSVLQVCRARVRSMPRYTIDIPC